MNWLANQLRNVGSFFTGNAAWLEKQDTELKAKMNSYNSTMRWITGISFVIGVIVGKSI